MTGPDRRAVLGALGSLFLASPVPAQDLPAELRFGGPFSLVAADGRRVTDADFRGRWMLLAFGYTRCPDICPTDLTSMGLALDQLGPLAERIQPIFVTVDPARDTADILGPFAAAFHPRLLGLTGTEAEVAAAARVYRVHRRKVLRAPGDPDYLVDHGSLMYLMAPDGSFATLFPTGTTPERMAQVLGERVR